MDTHQINRRADQRFKLQAMYTRVLADGPSDSPINGLQGHVYDISRSGVRIELDEPLDVGQPVNLRIDLPGGEKDISAAAAVVWVNDAQDDPGPRRMALRFGDFQTDADRTRLMQYLGDSARKAA